VAKSPITFLSPDHPANPYAPEAPYAPSANVLSENSTIPSPESASMPKTPQQGGQHE